MLNLQLVETQVRQFLNTLQGMYGAQFRPSTYPDKIQFEVVFFSSRGNRVSLMITITASRLSVLLLDARNTTIFTDSFTDNINSHTRLINAIKRLAEK